MALAWITQWSIWRPKTSKTGLFDTIDFVVIICYNIWALCGGFFRFSLVKGVDMTTFAFLTAATILFGFMVRGTTRAAKQVSAEEDNAVLRALTAPVMANAEFACELDGALLRPYWETDSVIRVAGGADDRFYRVGPILYAALRDLYPQGGTIGLRPVKRLLRSRGTEI